MHALTAMYLGMLSYPSKRRLRVDSMALSTLRMACSMEELTKVSPSLLTAGTAGGQRIRERKGEMGENEREKEKE